jgi:hypothetical protein
MAKKRQSMLRKEKLFVVTIVRKRYKCAGFLATFAN